MRDYNEFNSNRGKRYKSEEGRNKQNKKNSRPTPHPLEQYVSETEEEDQHTDEEGNVRKTKKIKVMTLGHLSNLLNSKLFTDDFDTSSMGRSRK